MAVFEIVVRNGMVIDPDSGLNSVLDIGIKSGRILQIGPDLPRGRADTDASGCFVSAGWIDLHTHVYEHATILGVNPDSQGLRKGVTTVVDGGSSGAMTFHGLRKYIVEPSRTRVLAFLHIAAHGLAGAACSGNDAGGESDHLNALKEDLCVECVESNRDVIVGVKVRLDRSITNGGTTEHEAYARALRASQRAKVPLMVHHTNSSIPLDSSPLGILACPGSLRQGDIYTHAFHGHASTILDRASSRLHPGVKQAHDRGVVMDVGHGQGSFDWEVATQAMREGFFPDTISTDLHSGNVNGTAQSLAHVMTKFLTLGMPLSEIIRAVTSTPARCLGKRGDFGRLAVGLEADLTIFTISDDQMQMGVDSFDKARVMKRTFTPLKVVRHGELYDCELQPEAIP